MKKQKQRNIIVVPEGKQFKVLVDYIQRGILYSSEEMANVQKDKLQQDEMFA